jgi:sugar O-acyltransferase (sialic acid O-acetyltransferase NeuD family)
VGRELFIFGAGPFAVEVAGWAEESGHKVAGLVELVDPARVGTREAGHPVVDVANVPSGAGAVVAGARGQDRRVAWGLAEARGCEAVTIVHPRANVSASATVGDGSVVAPAAVIGAGTAIAEHVLISRGTLVGHHVTVGPFVRLLPGANIASHVEVGADAQVNMAAAVVDGITVGETAIVAAGAVVLRDVPAHTRVQGVPARAVPGSSSAAGR